MTQKIIKKISLLGASFGLIFSSFLGLNINAQETFDLSELSIYSFVDASDIAVYPCESEVDSSFSQSKSWLIKKAKAGSNIEACVLVANPTSETKTIKVAPQDGLPSSGGSLSMSSESDELTALGSWIDLGQDTQTTITLDSGKGREFKFSINVPSNVDPGEYGGAISITELVDDNNSGNFQILKRYGNRVYVTVTPEEELTLGTEFSNFEFIVPGAQSYESFTSKAKAYAWNDMAMNWKFETVGNIFTKKKGTLTITNPQGQTSTKEFSADFFPKNEVIMSYVGTDSLWTTPGTYKARFEFEHEPNIPWNKPENVEDISSVNFVETEISMTQEMLDQLKADKVTLDSDKDNKNKDEDAKAAGIEAFKGEQETVQTGDEEEDNNLQQILIIGGIAFGVVILILIAVIVYLVMKSKKSDKKEDSKKDKK